MLRERERVWQKTLPCTHHNPHGLQRHGEQVSTCLGLCSRHGERCFRADFVSDVALLREKLYRTYMYIRTRELTRRAVHGGVFCSSSDCFRSPLPPPPTQLVRSAYQSNSGQLKRKRMVGWRQGSRSGLSRTSSVAVVPCSLAPGEKGEPCGVASHNR